MASRIPVQGPPVERTAPRRRDPAVNRGPAVLLGLVVALGWLVLMLALRGTGRTTVVVVGLLALNATTVWFLAHHVEPDEDDPVIPGPCTRRPRR